MSRRNNIILESYKVRIPDQYHNYVFNLLNIAQELINAILIVKWKEYREKGKIEIDNKGKAYVALGGTAFKGSLFYPLYLPNRFVRCIFEEVGRILRSQDERQDIYTSLVYGWEINKNFIPFDIIGAIADDEIYEALDIIRELREKYDSNLINQEIKHIRNLVRKRYRLLKEGKDIRNYFDVTLPQKKSLSLDYAVDSDSQLCKISWDGTYLNIEMKVPTVAIPISPKDWKWISFKVRPTKKLLERLRQGCKIKKPRLVAKRVTNGRLVPMLEIVVEVPCEKNIDESIKEVLRKRVKKLKRNVRVLSIDLGLRKFATCVPFEVTKDGQIIQLGRPIFVRENNSILRKLSRLFDEVSRIQSKLSRLREGSRRWRILYREFHRKWRKIRNIIYQLKHYVSTFIVRLAKLYNCDIIVVGKLDSYRPPAGYGKLSSLLTMVFPRSVRLYLEYKCKRSGIVLVTVSEEFSSRICPKCGKIGLTVKSYNNLTQCRTGRVFYCPHCKYMADRDYVGALNIFRIFLKKYLSSLSYYSYTYTPINPRSNAPRVSPSVCVSSGVFSTKMQNYLTTLTVIIHPLQITQLIMTKTTKDNNYHSQ
ncbi:MAG: transposase [Crenarchaeota archaeon]|nr:transposase [Thermoproteota archaeon]